MARGPKAKAGPADYGPSEARRHGDVAMELRSATEGEAKRARRLTPCERLHRRGVLTRAERDAGERLAGDWFEAGYERSTTVNLFGLGGGEQDFTPKQLDARRRFNAAMRGAGPGLADALYTICCLEASVSDMERDQGWRPTTGLVVLKIALGQLARHYGGGKNTLRHAGKKSKVGQV